MRKKPTAADIILIVLVTLGSLVWLGSELFGRAQGAAVEIYNQQGLYRRLDLGIDARLNVPGPLGVTLVVIQGGQVHIHASPCPDKLCVEMGQISKTGGNLICAPNRVSVHVIGQAQAPDAVSY